MFLLSEIKKQALGYRFLLGKPFHRISVYKPFKKPIMKNNFIILFLLAVSSTAYAQFQHSIGTEAYETGRSVQTTVIDKGYILGGYTNFQVFGNFDATLVKTKPDGSIQWSAVYGRENLETFNSVREVPYTSSIGLPPGYAAVGSTRSAGGFGLDDIYFVRTNLAGVPLFSRLYGRTKTDRAHCLQYIKDPIIGGYGYVMVGETNSYPFYGGTDVYVAKTNEFGNIVRATVIGGSGNESGYWIEQTMDGGFIVVGTTNSRSCGTTILNQEIFVIRLNPNLVILWNAIIGAGSVKTLPDVAYGVVENPIDGSFTITGITRSFGLNASGDAYLLNLKSNGAFNWMKTYGMYRSEQGSSIHLTRNPFTGAVEYVVGGFSTSHNPLSMRNAYAFKTDMNGNLLWTMLYGAKTRSAISEITENEVRGYVFAGDIESNWSYKNDIYHVKTDFNGKTGTGCDSLVRQHVMPHTVCYTSSAQQVFVTETIQIQHPYKPIDYKVNKCDPTLRGADDTSSDELSARPETDLAAALASSNDEIALLKIYNIRGELVSQMSYDNLDASIRLLPQGFYVVHVIKKDGTVTSRKIMK
jgi:hypothetical protein